MTPFKTYRLNYQAGLVSPGEYVFVRWHDLSRSLAVVRSVNASCESILHSAHLHELP